MSSKYLKLDFTEEEIVELAKRRIKSKRELYSHIAAYIFVNTFLLFISMFGNEFEFSINAISWNLWVLAGWGLGLMFHIFETIQELNFKYNANAVEKEIGRIKKTITKQVDNK